ncbi:11270_t:CDS:2 [Entrophospora sp. SA101]|nr:11270_t:CDS:2 [Entrophospora sp. SA101]
MQQEIEQLKRQLNEQQKNPQPKQVKKKKPKQPKTRNSEYFVSNSKPYSNLQLSSSQSLTSNSRSSNSRSSNSQSSNSQSSIATSNPQSSIATSNPQSSIATSNPQSSIATSNPQSSIANSRSSTSNSQSSTSNSQSSSSNSQSSSSNSQSSSSNSQSSNSQSSASNSQSSSSNSQSSSSNSQLSTSDSQSSSSNSQSSTSDSQSSSSLKQNHPNKQQQLEPTSPAIVAQPIPNPQNPQISSSRSPQRNPNPQNTQIRLSKSPQPNHSSQPRPNSQPQPKPNRPHNLQPNQPTPSSPTTSPSLTPPITTPPSLNPSTTIPSSLTPSITIPSSLTPSITTSPSLTPLSLQLQRVSIDESQAYEEEPPPPYEPNPKFEFTGPDIKVTRNESYDDGIDPYVARKLALIGYLDIYPSTFKLESKGDYVIRAQVRHQSQPILEKLNNTVCLLDFNLSKKVSLDVYNQISDVFTSSKSTVGRLALEKGSRQALFIGSPNDYSSYPKDAKPGDILTGKLNFINNSANRIDGGQNFINLIIPPAPIKPKELIPSDNNHATAGDNSGGDPGKDSGSDDVDVAQSTEIPPPPIEKTKEEKAIENLNEAIRDVQIANLKKFPIDSSYLTDLLSELEDKYPKHLPLYQAKLEIFLETAKSSTSNTNTTELTVENAKIVIDTADELLSKIDLLELARYYGVKQETNVNESAKKIKKENDEKKKAAVLALRSKAQALMVLAQKAAATNKNGLLERFEETYKSLIQWLDSIPPTSDIKNLLVYISRERQAKRYGNALKAINKYFAENSLTNDSTRDYEKLFDIKFDILKEVGWTIWENNEKKWKLIRIPPSGYP